MITYHEGEHGIRTAYSVEEAAQFEKDGYKQIDVSDWGTRNDVVKPKRKRRSKKQIEADKKAEE